MDKKYRAYILIPEIHPLPATPLNEKSKRLYLQQKMIQIRAPLPPCMPGSAAYKMSRTFPLINFKSSDPI